MRAAVIFGLGTSPADLKLFQAGSSTEWMQGLPASSSEADAILIFGGDGTIHRHLSALVRLQLPVLIVPAGSGNDFARALQLRSLQDSLRAWRDFESGRIQRRTVDLGVIVEPAAPDRIHYFCCVAGCGLDSAVTRRANEMPRWLRGHGGYALALCRCCSSFRRSRCGWRRSMAPTQAQTMMMKIATEPKGPLCSPHLPIRNSMATACASRRKQISPMENSTSAASTD